MIFPEFLYLNRLDRLKKVYKQSKLNRDILLAVLLIDEKDNHEYFLHKYKVSNNINEALEKLSKNLKKIKLSQMALYFGGQKLNAKVFFALF